MTASLGVSALFSAANTIDYRRLGTFTDAVDDDVAKTRDTFASAKRRAGVDERISRRRSGAVGKRQFCSVGINCTKILYGRIHGNISQDMAVGGKRGGEGGKREAAI